VVEFVAGPFAGKIASIIEIVDHKRVRLHPGELPGGSLEADWKNARGKIEGIGG
jgi:hypothetical protein